MPHAREHLLTHRIPTCQRTQDRPSMISSWGWTKGIPSRPSRTHEETVRRDLCLRASSVICECVALASLVVALRADACCREPVIGMRSPCFCVAPGRYEAPCTRQHQCSAATDITQTRCMTRRAPSAADVSCDQLRPCRRGLRIAHCVRSEEKPKEKSTGWRIEDVPPALRQADFAQLPPSLQVGAPGLTERAKLSPCSNHALRFVWTCLDLRYELYVHIPTPKPCTMHVYLMPLHASGASMPVALVASGSVSWP